MESWRQELYMNELYHHGIKGQKWGERRFQYEDGSLTPAGEKRYNVGNAKSNLKAAKQEYKAAKKSKDKEAINKANLKVVRSQAELAKAKGGERAEFRSYRNEMFNRGMRNSAQDFMTGKRATKLYNDIAANKGKEYADRVERSVRNMAFATIAMSGALMVGAAYADKSF